MNTPRRTIRIEDDIWLPAKAKADEEGTNVTDVIRKALTAYVKAGAAVVLAVLAFVTLTACGANEPSTTPAAERTAVVSAPVAETPSVAVTPACWEMTGEVADEYNAFLPGPALDEWLTALPDPSHGCTVADSYQLTRFKSYLD